MLNFYFRDSSCWESFLLSFQQQQQLYQQQEKNQTHKNFFKRWSFSQSKYIWYEKNGIFDVELSNNNNIFCVLRLMLIAIVEFSEEEEKQEFRKEKERERDVVDVDKTFFSVDVETNER